MISLALPAVGAEIDTPEQKHEKNVLTVFKERMPQYLAPRDMVQISMVKSQNHYKFFSKAPLSGSFIKNLENYKELASLVIENRKEIIGDDMSRQLSSELLACIKKTYPLEMELFHYFITKNKYEFHRIMAEQGHLLPKNSQLMSFMNNNLYTLFTNEMDLKRYFDIRVKEGDQNAQKNLNRAALNQELGFTTETGRKYLKERTAQGDQDAKEHLNIAALNQRLGFTMESGRKYLEKIAAEGDQDAKNCLKRAALNQELGFTAETGRKYLEKIADEGDQDAKNCLKRAALNQELGFTAESGRKYLEKIAAEGDQDAQEDLNYAALYQLLDFTEITNRGYLEERAKQEDQNAKDWLNYAALNQLLGFTTEKEAQDLPNDEALHQIDEYDEHYYRYYHLFISMPEDIRQYIDSNKENQYMKELVDSAVMYQKLGFTQEDGIKCASFKQGADQGNRLVQMYFDYTFIKQFILPDKHEVLWEQITHEQQTDLYTSFNYRAINDYFLDPYFISNETKIAYILGRLWLGDYVFTTFSSHDMLFHQNRTAFYYYALLGYIPLTHQ